jgi:hypothetical protein
MFIIVGYLLLEFFFRFFHMVIISSCHIDSCVRFDKIEVSLKCQLVTYNIDYCSPESLRRLSQIRVACIVWVWAAFIVLNLDFVRVVNMCRLGGSNVV